MPQFVRDLDEIRRRAERNLDDGAVTEGYKADVGKTIAILNEALATEIVCVLRYLHHYFMATGVHGKSVADEFKEHADSEREHADLIAERIQQLGGKPDFNPKSLLQRSVSHYVEGETLAQMIREDLVAERIVIEVYQQMIRYFRDQDPTTRVIIERILKDEEEHASDLSDLLYIVDPQTGKTEGRDPGTDPLQKEGSDSRRAAGDKRQNGARRLDSRSSAHEAAESAPAWRPGEPSPAAPPLARKRHESQHAGPPGAPGFAEAPRVVDPKIKAAHQERPNKRGEKRTEKNSKVAHPHGRKPAA